MGIVPVRRGVGLLIPYVDYSAQLKRSKQNKILIGNMLIMIWASPLSTGNFHIFLLACFFHSPVLLPDKLLHPHIGT